MSQYTVKYALLLIMLYSCASILLAQHVVQFNAPAEVCLNERFLVQNNSDPGITTEWNFCGNPLGGAYSSSGIGNLTGNITDLVIQEENDMWYGFATSRDGGIVKILFGSNLNNTPISINNLGTLGGLIDRPESIALEKDGANWYGLILNRNEIIRVSWGASLANNPSAVSLNLSASGKLSTPTEIEIERANGQFVAVIANNGTGRVSLVNFGSTLTNNPTTSEIKNSEIFPGASDFSSVTVARVCGTWNIYASATAKMYKVDVGTNLYDDITANEIFDFSSDIPVALGQYNRIESIVTGDKTYIFFTSYTGGYIYAAAWTNGEPLPEFLPLGNLITPQNPYVLEAFVDENGYGLFLSGFITGATSRIRVSSACSAAPQYSQASEPLPISYAQSGIYEISLAITFSDGSVCATSRTITVNGNPAPPIVINAIKNCVKTPVDFSLITAPSLPVSSPQWDFGDGSISAEQTPSHQYSAANEYTVHVQVSGSNGCNNYTEKTIKIYNPPVSSFNLPSGLICTNNQFTFANNTIDNFDGNLSYQWYVDNTPFATTRDFSYAFSTTGSKGVKLKTSIPGCSSEQTQTLTNVLPGPVVGFTITGKCENENILFANNSSGSITGSSWDFGNSQTSTLLNPTQNYSKGNYTVSLQATAANGCVSSTAKNLAIYSTPQPDFSIGLPPFSCAGSASQFTDATPAPTDSNITNWTWGFGDAANGTSSVKNPSYTYATANTYNVSLAVATNFGCTNSIQKAVTISTSPVAGFTNLPACVNQATQFTDASSGSIKSRQWQIQGSTFIVPNPQFTYPSSGTFPVILTVTGNNNCVSQATKNIVVPVVPSLDFSVQAPCANSSTVFTELTTSADPSVSKNWSFGSQGTGSGSPAQYAFSTTGTYAVRLNSTRQSGCVYTVSKNVNIVSPPIADFEPSIDAGAAPLPVSFANTSSGASSYLWKFGDQGNSTSVLVSPTFVFSELGAYNVELSASNSIGCTNRLSKPISVVIPTVDAEMTDFFFVKDQKTGSLQPVVKLLNKSNITLTDPTILLDVAGGSSVSQQITGTLKPNQEISQMLDLKLVPKTNQYVCAEVVVAGDSETFLNRKCLSLSGEEVLFSPFPNPAREQLNMDWISIDGSAVTFQVLTSGGAASFQQTISSINPGLNRLIINTSALSPGIYFIRFRDGKTDRTFSFAVAGN
jgi:PKD repeat protein